MAFILYAQRSSSPDTLQRYRKYLQSVRASFPPLAFDLANSEWYFSFRDHRCPHDSWLESVVIEEPSFGERHQQRSTSMRIRLRAAFHDGFIEYHYPIVFNYSLGASDVSKGHLDWLYDEFRLSDAGNLIHEIEWAGGDEIARWLIEASDVSFHWIPDQKA